jgi:hypothetical protein
MNDILKTLIEITDYFKEIAEDFAHVQAKLEICIKEAEKVVRATSAIDKELPF